jgi:hypothetical protein
MVSRPTTSIAAIAFVAIPVVLMSAALAPSLARADDIVPYQGKFSLTYTFTTSSPAKPQDVSPTLDLTVNNYLVTTVNDAGSGFLHLAAGHCTNVRFTDRVKKTIDSRGYCMFEDKNNDRIYAEYTTGTPKPSDAIIIKCKFTSGTGQYEGITGEFDGTNSNNISKDATSYQAAGKFNGSYKIVRTTSQDTNGLVQ